MTNQGKEPLPAGRWPLYNDCAEDVVHLVTIIPLIQAERAQEKQGTIPVETGETFPGRWTLYNDCAEETRIMLARINRRLREERSTDH